MGIKAISPSHDVQDLFIESFLWGYRDISADSLKLDASGQFSDEQRKTDFLLSTYLKEEKLYVAKESIHWLGAYTKNAALCLFLILEKREDDSLWVRQMVARKGMFFRNRQRIKEYIRKEFDADTVYFVTRSNRIGQKCERILARYGAEVEGSLDDAEHSSELYTGLRLALS